LRILLSGERVVLLPQDGVKVVLQLLGGEKVVHDPLGGTKDKGVEAPQSHLYTNLVALVWDQ